MMWGGDEGLKGCAARTGEPASALDPLIATPRFAEMPFRRGGSTAAGRVISNVPLPIARIGGSGAVSVFRPIKSPPRRARSVAVTQ